MRYRKLSSTGDYVFGNGQLDFYRDIPEAPGQAAKTRLLLWLGEWFLNVDEGTPFLQGILGKKPKELADTTIRQRILTTQGVTDISSYESAVNPETRFMSVTAEINTIYGPTSLALQSYKDY